MRLLPNLSANGSLDQRYSLQGVRASLSLREGKEIVRFPFSLERALSSAPVNKQWTPSFSETVG